MGCACCEPGSILLCMGLFSRFFVSRLHRLRCEWIASLALAMTADGRAADLARHNAPQRRFPACQIDGGGGASAPPTQSRAELQPRRRRWDKTSEVPAVHGALHWWALSKAVKPHFSKPYWRALAPSPAPAASMPERPSATPAPRPAVTRWAPAS